MISNPFLQTLVKSQTMYCGLIGITVWMHHLDSKETHGEKLNENYQILEAAAYKTVAVRPLTSHLTNHLNKTNKTCCEPLEK